MTTAASDHSVSGALRGTGRRAASTVARAPPIPAAAPQVAVCLLSIEPMGRRSAPFCAFRAAGPDSASGRSGEIDERPSIVDRFPPFRPHRLLRSGHLQTVVATIFSGQSFPYRAVRRPVLLESGDSTMLHDDRPTGWMPPSPVALLIHGLAGCSRSPYMVRVSGRLNEAGVRTFRMDLRACGAGEGLARLPYHPGCSHDLLAAVRRVTEICPGSPIHLVGFSIGGNVALKTLGEWPDRLPPELCRAVVVNPSIDLPACIANLSKGAARFYDRHFVKLNYRQLRRSALLVEHAPHVVDAPRPRGQREFDDMYTAGMWGYKSVDRFYAETSAVSAIPDVRVPTLLIASRDDPLVPFTQFERLSPPASITMHLTDHGGHLGFIGRRNGDPDRRWMDWRIVDWVTAAQAAPAVKAA